MKVETHRIEITSESKASQNDSKRQSCIVSPRWSSAGHARGFARGDRLRIVLREAAARPPGESQQFSGSAVAFRCNSPRVQQLQFSRRGSVLSRHRFSALASIQRLGLERVTRMGRARPPSPEPGEAERRSRRRSEADRRREAEESRKGL